jgi:hypothetical protein
MDKFEFQHLLDLIIFQFIANKLMIINPNKYKPINIITHTSKFIQQWFS